MTVRNAADSNLEFQHWLSSLTRRAPVFLAVLFAVLAVGAVTATFRAPDYEATADVSIGRPPTVVLLDPTTTTPDLPAELKAAQDAEVVQLAATDRAPGADVEVSIDEASNSLLFTATGPSAGPVADAANGYARAFIQLREARVADQYASAAEDLRAAISLVDQRLAALGPRSPTTAASRQSLRDQRGAYQAALERLEVAAVLGGPLRAQLSEPASPPSEPSSPSLLEYLAYALLAGLFLAAGMIALLEFRDKSVTGSEAARSMSGVPVLATVSGGSRRWSKKRRSTSGISAQDGVAATGNVMLDDPRSTQAESFRSLRATLTSLMKRASKVVQVTSAAEDDGAAAVATNLAIALAQSGESTVLVDLDRHVVELPFEQASNPPGLDVLFSGTSSLSESLWTVRGVAHLRVLQAGEDDSDDVLTHPALGPTLRQLLERSSYVVMLSPPVLSSSVTLHLAPFVDARLLCVRPGSTLTPDLEKVSDTLTLVEPGVLGVILT